MVNMFNNLYKGKKVLITGNTGFKGSWLSSWLIDLGAKVYGISNGIPTSPSMFEILDLSIKTTHFNEDVRNYKNIEEIIRKIKPDFLFHMAAQPLVVTSYIEPSETITTNVIGTTNILEALRVVNCNCTALIITSDKCYDNVEWVWGYKESDTLGGKDIYSGSKGAAEIIFKSYYHSYFKNRKNSNVRVVSVRAGNVIGGGDWAEYRIVPDCAKAWANNKSVEIRSPEATRPWQHVLEPLSGYLLCAQVLHDNLELNGESFNFGPKSDYTKSVKDLIEDLSLHWNLKNNAYSIPDSISKFHEAGLLKLNIDKSYYHLKWRPNLSYEKLIELTGKWYNNYYNSKINMLEFTIEQINEYQEIAKTNNLVWTK
jgi:CDP-glucose 4,6-dehydratase